MTTKTLNIFERLSKITEELATVKKELTVGSWNMSYKAVSERDILDAVKPLEVKYWVYSYPISREIVDNSILTKKSEYNWKEKETNSLYMRLRVTYRFVNIDKPEEFIETIVYWDGIDTWDKWPWKAMTYADKYALMKMYKISTWDDPDKDASPSSWYTKASNDDAPRFNDEDMLKLTEFDAYKKYNSADECVKAIRKKRKLNKSFEARIRELFDNSEIW